MSIIGDLVNFATMLDEQHDRLLQARRDRRDRAADLLGSIAGTLDLVVGDLKQEDTPHGACQQMLSYADALPDAIGDELGVEAERMADLLRRSYEVETLVMELDRDPDRDRQIRKLERAAGLVRATADLLRASG